MKNKPTDLSMHLFAELERLSDEDLRGEALREEIDRAKAVTNVAEQIISNNNTVLKAVLIRSNCGNDQPGLPGFLDA